jgi:hypothetical protein
MSNQDFLKEKIHCGACGKLRTRYELSPFKLRNRKSIYPLCNTCIEDVLMGIKKAVDTMGLEYGS